MNFDPLTKARPTTQPGFDPATGKRRARPEAIIIRPRDLMALLSVSRHGLSKIEGLPAPIKLGPRSIGYLKAEIDAFIEARMAARG